MSAPRVSVVIVNWNTRARLRDCLRSLSQASADLPREIVVVDNASSDGSAAMVRREFPAAKLVETGENLGFAGGANRGLALASPDSAYVLFLNPDTLAGEDALRSLVGTLDVRPEAGAATCAMTDALGRFQEAQAHRLPSVSAALSQYLFLNRLFSDELFPGLFWTRRPVGTVPVEWISGAAMLVRRGALHYPFFDERYFMYAEDMEASRAIALRGWTLLFVGGAEMVHHLKSGTRQAGERVLRASVTSQLVYLRRHCSRAEYAAIRGLMLAGYLLRAAAYAPAAPARSRDQWANATALLRFRPS